MPLPGRPIDEQQAGLLSGLGRAQAALLELPRAAEVVANLTRAFDYYADPEISTARLRSPNVPWMHLPGQVVGGARLVARALELVEPDSHAAGRLLARYARMLTIEAGDYQAAAEACERAVSIAQREGDVHLEIEALGNGAEADLNYFRWHDGLVKCQRAIELARLHGALHAEMYARFFACIMLWLRGNLDRAREYAAALLERAEQLRDQRWRVAALWLAGTSARDGGDWAVARTRLDRGLELSQSDPRLLWTRIVLEHAVGELSVVKSLLARLLDVVPLSPATPDLAQASTALMLVSLPDAVVSASERAMAESAAAAILSLPTITDAVATNARVSLALAALQRGDAAAVHRHYPLLQHVRGTLILYLGMSGDRLLGRLARAIGERDLAAHHFDDALRFCRDNRCRSGTRVVVLRLRRPGAREGQCCASRPAMVGRGGHAFARAQHAAPHGPGRRGGSALTCIPASSPTVRRVLDWSVPTPRFSIASHPGEPTRDERGSDRVHHHRHADSAFETPLTVGRS